VEEIIMNNKSLPSQVVSYVNMAKEEYLLYSKNFNISNLISYEKYRDRIVKVMNFSVSEADMLIIN
jgi:hypothetical protein